MTCMLCSIDSTWLVGPCRIDFSQIQYYMAFVPYNIDYTYVESNIRIFDMTWAAKIETSVISILAAPDPCKNIHVEIQQLVYPDQLYHRG